MGLFGFGKKNLTAAQLEGKELEEYISSKKKELKEVEKTLKTLEKEKENQSNLVEKKRNEIESFDQKLNTLKKEVIDTEDSLDMQTYGFYIPKYDFATALGYKEKLKAIRDEQKTMVRLKTAVSYSDNWTVDGSKAKGRKMTNDNIRQIIRSFNNECDAAITKVKYNNLPAAEKRIDTSFNQLNKMNSSNKVSITSSYLNLKRAELYLAYEYERKREDEKEALREQRQREREEKALQKEIQSQKKIIDKDIKHYQNIIDELKQKLEKLTNDEDREELENQIIELYSKVSEKEEEKEELDYRTAHASAGYVYIISNIGAFGEDVFKIGVTRRLEPLERIGELSSASVPFRFDVHALIFSYEAYQLEAELHEYFSAHRINKVNNRKEFFRLPIESIEKKLKDYKDLTIDFTKTPDAEEYRESMNVTNQISI